MPRFVPVTNPELTRAEQDQDADMAKHRALVDIHIVLEGDTGNKKEDFPAEATVVAQACDATDSTLEGPAKTTTVTITGTDTLDTFKTAVLAAVDTLIGVP